MTFFLFILVSAIFFPGDYHADKAKYLSVIADGDFSRPQEPEASKCQHQVSMTVLCWSNTIFPLTEKQRRFFH
jgi:hypothetical protein